MVEKTHVVKIVQHDGLGSKASIERSRTIPEPCYRSSLTYGHDSETPANWRSVPKAGVSICNKVRASAQASSNARATDVEQRGSEHTVGVLGFTWNNLQHVPMFHDFTVVIQAENVDPSPNVITRPVLTTVQHNVITFRDDTHELDALARILPRRLLEIRDEPFFAVRYAGIVLDVGSAGIPLDSVARAALVKHQVIERDDVPLVALKVCH